MRDEIHPSSLILHPSENTLLGIGIAGMADKAKGKGPKEKVPAHPQRFLLFTFYLFLFTFWVAASNRIESLTIALGCVSMGNIAQPARDRLPVRRNMPRAAGIADRRRLAVGATDPER
jgi:hypothetical protein